MLRRLGKLSSLQKVSFSEISSSSYYMEQMYQSWKNDPKSVHPSWNAFFSSGAQATSESTPQASEIKETIKVLLLHRSFQFHGYMLADLDPLRLHSFVDEHGVPKRVPGLMRVENYGFSEEEMERVFDLGDTMSTGFLSTSGSRGGKWKLKELIENAQRVYCGKIGFEFMHIPFRDESNWMKQRIEVDQLIKHSAEEKKQLYQVLAKAHLLENFFIRKFTTHKRFGLEGLETVILSIESVIERAVEQGVDTFLIGMPHRGRLNVLANVCKSSLSDMFSMFLGTNARILEEGDVKYHLGHTVQRNIKDKTVTISLLANPSHLEAVNPVALGKTRAVQTYQNSRDRAMTILVHGDAALAGQGVVYETLQMEDLYQYGTGGVVHIVANNNIGFTTTPREARSGAFCTEVAKSIGAPIIHVNGDCPEEVDFASRMAADWRKEFRKSIFVDIIGYRRYGHNELDEPMFTNPKMYQLIHKHEPVFMQYQKKLIEEGVYTSKDIENYNKTIFSEYEDNFNSAKAVSEDDLKKNKPRTEWSDIVVPKSDPNRTGVDPNRLKDLGTKIFTLPEDFSPHASVKKLFKQRKNSIETGENIDWATGEALAFASLLVDGIHVRISGQDVQRGTFSQRHSVVHDQKQDMKTYIPLNHIEPNQASYNAANSHLSEFGVLGFEYGFSLTNPNALVLWEAQFGDFLNGAQVIIDQFISGGEAKWGQESGLVVLLPHGYDGQGSEHSSGRIERILGLSAENPFVIPWEQLKERRTSFYNNLQVIIPSTPANYFHFLRRQIRRDFRKPLFVFSPKRLLRHKEATSNLQEFVNDRALRLIGEVETNLNSPDQIRKVILCSGQVYYDIADERRKRKAKDIVIARVEQIAPFPFDKVQELAKTYPNAKFEWVQEEPLNSGCWTYVSPRIETALKGYVSEPVNVVSRPPYAASATGYNHVHLEELNEILERSME